MRQRRVKHVGGWVLGGRHHLEPTTAWGTVLHRSDHCCTQRHTCLKSASWEPSANSASLLNTCNTSGVAAFRWVHVLGSTHVRFNRLAAEASTQ